MGQESFLEQMMLDLVLKMTRHWPEWFKRKEHPQNRLWRPEAQENGELLGVTGHQGSAGPWHQQEMRKEGMRKTCNGGRGAEKRIKLK